MRHAGNRIGGSNPPASALTVSLPAWRQAGIAGTVTALSIAFLAECGNVLYQKSIFCSLNALLILLEEKRAHTVFSMDGEDFSLQKVGVTP